MATLIQQQIEAFERLKAQRDELLAALKEIDAIRLIGPHVDAKEAFEAALGVFIKARNIAHAAIKSAEESQ